MTGILLDTNALLWLVNDPGRHARPALDVLENPANDLFVSAASGWEVAIKTHLGRLDASPLLSAWNDTLATMAATDLPIEAADAVTAGLLNWSHRDPFDRMIVAQATRRGLSIATSDKTMHDGTLTPVVDIRR
ncbi:type II toxin-antitoxin system VapC family toxin [Gordonia sp. DT30]|uniref:type II toxin-antitoxin system VapC family toxin n=1 Tax=Gordonia sp. DT30 TaxID=3416546 RepID=UPI003CF15A2D